MAQKSDFKILAQLSNLAQITKSVMFLLFASHPGRPPPSPNLLPIPCLRRRRPLLPYLPLPASWKVSWGRCIAGSCIRPRLRRRLRLDSRGPLLRPDRGSSRRLARPCLGPGCSAWVLSLTPGGRRPAPPPPTWPHLKCEPVAAARAPRAVGEPRPPATAR